MLYWCCHFPRHFAEFFMSEISPSSNEKSSVLMNLQSLLLPVFCTDGITKEMRRLQTCLSWAGGQGVREADGHRLRRLIPKVENGSTCRHANVGQVFKCWTTRWSRSAAAQPQRRNNRNNQKHQWRYISSALFRVAALLSCRPWWFSSCFGQMLRFHSSGHRC